MFRKRAFTLAWKAGIDHGKASIAYYNVDTLMKHAVHMHLDEQEVADDVFARMNGGNGKKAKDLAAGEEE